MALCYPYEQKLKAQEMELKKKEDEIRRLKALCANPANDVHPNNLKRDLSRQQQLELEKFNASFFTEASSSSNSSNTTDIFKLTEQQSLQLLNPYHKNAGSESATGMVNKGQQILTEANGQAFQDNALKSIDQNAPINSNVQVVEVLKFSDWKKKHNLKDNVKSRGHRGGNKNKRAFFAKKYANKNNGIDETLGNVASFHVALANEAAKKTSKRNHGQEELLIVEISTTTKNKGFLLLSNLQ